MRIATACVCVVVFTCGCASSPQRPAPSNPISGLRPTTLRGGRYTLEQLIQIDIATIGFAEWYLARLAEACDALARQAESPEQRYEALRLKANQAASVYAIVSGPNPIIHVLDLAMLLNLTHQKWVREGRAATVFGQPSPVLVEAIEQSMRRGTANALRVVTEAELEVVRKSVAEWRQENPGLSEIEYIRLEDYITELARSVTPQEGDDLLSHVQAAAAGLDQTRLLGERAMYLTSRFPRVMQWQIEAQTAQIAAQPQAKQLVADLGQLARIAGDFQKQAAEFARMLDTLPQRITDTISTGPAVKQAFTTAGDAMARTDAAVKQMATLETAVRGLEGAVASLAEQVNRVNKAYDPTAVEKMGDDARAIAVREMRTLIYLATACAAGLLVLAAVLRWIVRPARANRQST
jgi:hypothetical protein